MYTFKAQDKSNAKRFLVKTCKLENFDDYLTQHDGSWGTWLDANGKPAPAATVAGAERTIAADTLPTAADVQAVVNATATDANEADPTVGSPAPGPVEAGEGLSASAFGAFALSQLAPVPAPAPAPAPDTTKPARTREVTSTTGLRIQKDRPMHNGVQRQSAGSVGDQLWALYDKAGPEVTLPQAKALAAAAGLSQTSAAIALYNWRRFNGIVVKK